MFTRDMHQCSHLLNSVAEAMMLQVVGLLHVVAVEVVEGVVAEEEDVAVVARQPQVLVH